MSAANATGSAESLSSFLPQAQKPGSAGLGLIVCLGVPFVIRLLLSWGFYGSTDAQNYLSAMEELLKGGDNLFNYYPPSFFPEALGALGGLLSGLPMTAVFKMSHAIPDLILAGWFYLKLTQAGEGRSRRAVYLLTFLLQLAPSVVLVSHIHGQMDSWSILFTVLGVEFFLQQKPAWAFVGGLAMIFGTGIKIFPLFLIPCFYLYRPWRFRHLALFTLGLIAGFGIYFSKYCAHPEHIRTIVTGALGYQSQPLMGIKQLIWPYLIKVHGGEPALRHYVIGALAVAYLFALFRRLDLYRSILLSLLAVMTVSFHMAPQYLLWPTFLLFFVGLYRTAVFYNVGAGALLVFYYYCTRDNSGAYAPLVGWETLAPVRPHWYDEPWPLHIFNHRLRGAGIWLVIFFSLVALLVTILRRPKTPRPSAVGEPADFPSPAGRKYRMLGLGVIVVAYALTLLFTWPSPFRRTLARQFDSDYYRQNFFSYGSNYLYEVSIPAKNLRELNVQALSFRFSGNDFYAIFQNSSPLLAPFVGSRYPAHHAGVFGYRPKVHSLAEGTGTGPARPNDEVRVWILDGNGSIERYELPGFDLLTPNGEIVSPTVYQVKGCKLTREQLLQLFSIWRKEGRLPPDLAKVLGTHYDLSLSSVAASGANPAAGLAPRENHFSIIEGLWIYLCIWGILGFLPKTWSSTASNT